MSIVAEIEPQSAGGALVLDPVLDLIAAERLHAQLVGLRGQPLEIDASAVERMGGLCLQVLLSAQKTWEADGGSVRFNAVSPAFQQTWDMFAAPPFATDFSPGQGAES
jgi:chemotaxis protein CheX